MQNLQNYFNEFDKTYSNLETIGKDFYNDLGVVAYCNNAKTKDTKGNLSEEYIRARFVYALVHSGMYQKEYICVEFSIPKGNNAKAIKPDIVIFKNKDWQTDFQNKDFHKIRQNILVIFEAKKNTKTVNDATENQLRSAMTENTSKDRIFGVYFDEKSEIIIFKKFRNSEIKRYYESKAIQQDGITAWNINNRDLLVELPSQKDFIENNQSISDLTKLKLNSLDSIDESTFTDLMANIKRIADKAKPSNEQGLIVEFLTLKVFDEKRSKRHKDYLHFYILDGEKTKDGLGTEEFRTRINQLYNDARKEYENVLSREKRLFSYDNQLHPSKTSDERYLIALIEVFQRRAILTSKSENFNQIIFNNFGNASQKADKGQFFTPIPVVNNMIRMLNPIMGEEVCDPCCGICDFPAMAFRHAHRNEEQFPPNASHYYGFDIDPSNLKLAELNPVLNGDGGAVLQSMDSLQRKLLDDADKPIEIGDFTTKNYDINTRQAKHNPDLNIKKYDIIATNPPFGKGRDLSTGKDGKYDIPLETIELYETYHHKLDDDKQGNKKYPNSMDMGALFLENALKSLKDGGRMGLVLSNSIASIAEWKNIRAWFLSKVRLVAVFDLPSNTFGETGVATTILIAYKPKKHEKHLLSNDYEVFIKDIENIGYEVKTVKRTIEFQPQYLINQETFERLDRLDEDFTQMQADFKEFLKRQEEEIKHAFHLDKMD